MAYGGIQARMEAQAESIAKLEQVPVQIANIRTEIQSSTAGIRVEQAQRLADITQRMATVEQRSQRNYENNTTQWEVIRDNQGKVASLIRNGDNHERRPNR
jgi:Zn-dependent oligopeptidase